MQEIDLWLIEGANGNIWAYQTSTSDQKGSREEFVQEKEQLKKNTLVNLKSDQQFDKIEWELTGYLQLARIS